MRTFYYFVSWKPECVKRIGAHEGPNELPPNSEGSPRAARLFFRKEPADFSR
jgi:hypothetical protein